MECVLADEATDMGGEWSEREWRMLLSLFGDGDPESADGLTFSDVILELSEDMPITNSAD